MKLPGATTRVLSSLLLGAVVGLALARWHPDAAATAAAIAQPIGRLWLSALQMTVVPLVLALVILGVASAADAATSGRVARRAMVLFVAMLSLFAAYAAIVAPALLSLVPRSEQLAATLAGTAATATSSGAPSLADVYLIPQVESARRFGVDMAAWPLIRAVDAACAELPAFARAAPAAQPDA